MLPDRLVGDRAVGEVETDQGGEPPADGEAQLVSGHVRHVEAGEARQPRHGGAEGAGQVAATGDLPVLGQAVPQPLAEGDIISLGVTWVRFCINLQEALLRKQDAVF